MLPDPLVIPFIGDGPLTSVRTAITAISLDSASVPTITQDGLASKRSVTLGEGAHPFSGGAVPLKLGVSISHSETKENAPFTTGRTVIRIDASKVNETTGKPVVLSAYLVVVLPQSPDWTVDDAVAIARSVTGLALLGSPVSGTFNTADDGFLTRAINLES